MKKQAIREPERAIHKALVEYLHARGVLMHHSPNEGKRSLVGNLEQIRMGMMPGFPDLIIFTQPPKFPDARGVALEIKTEEGSLTPAQHNCLAFLTHYGWQTGVGYGFDGCMGFIHKMGW